VNVPDSQTSRDAEASAWLRRASRGDEDAQRALVERFTPALLAQAQYRVGAPLRRFVDPSDVVADVWLVALRRLPAFDPAPGRATGTFLAYLGTVLLRRVRDLYERHLAGKPEVVPHGAAGADGGAGLELSAHTTGVVTRVVRAERAAALTRALDELEPLDRAVVALRAIEGQRNEVVAALTGLASNAVSQRLRRALAKLRERLPESIFDDLTDA
jgi:RNA polymerase sigma factor (sigma-70 family)